MGTAHRNVYMGLHTYMTGKIGPTFLAISRHVLNMVASEEKTFSGDIISVILFQTSKLDLNLLFKGKH